MNQVDERKYIGNLSQIFDVKEYRMLGGRADGLRAVDVDNGAGLCATILADRCMDLGRVTFQGMNVSFLSPCGYVAPAYYDESESNWLRSFTAGLMTTCGFANIGSPCEDNGERLGLHGRIANIPAEQFGVTLDETNECVTMRGLMRQSTVFQDNLLLTREITMARGENKIRIKDQVRNAGYRKSPFMMLYHCNLGYPFLDEDAAIWIPAEETKARDAHAKEGFAKRNQLEVPSEGYQEMCFYHRMRKQDGAFSGAAVYQEKRGIGLAIWYNAEALDHFTQWKMMGAGEYVLGLEPGNAWVDGRAVAKEQNDLRFLAPGECAQHELVFEFFGAERAEEIRKKLCHA